MSTSSSSVTHGPQDQALVCLAVEYRPAVNDRYEVGDKVSVRENIDNTHPMHPLVWSAVQPVGIQFAQAPNTHSQVRLATVCHRVGLERVRVAVDYRVTKRRNMLLGVVLVVVQTVGKIALPNGQQPPVGHPLPAAPVELQPLAHRLDAAIELLASVGYPARYPVLMVPFEKVPLAVFGQHRFQRIEVALAYQIVAAQIRLFDLVGGVLADRFKLTPIADNDVYIRPEVLHNPQVGTPGPLVLFRSMQVWSDSHPSDWIFQAVAPFETDG